MESDEGRVAVAFTLNLPRAFRGCNVEIAAGKKEPNLKLYRASINLNSAFTGLTWTVRGAAVVPAPNPDTRVTISHSAFFPETSTDE